jgi:hypothetical protein
MELKLALTRFLFSGRGNRRRMSAMLKERWAKAKKAGRMNL